MAKKAVSKKDKTSNSKVSPTRAAFEAPVIEVQQGRNKFYLFKISVRKLGKVVGVNRRNPDQNEGYQRHFSPSRVRAISKYYDDGGAVPNCILVSFDRAEIKAGKISVPEKKMSGWVIDGQHRFLGALEAEKDVEVPVVAFIALPLKEQISQFVTINREAKGVPSSLYIDLLKNLPRNKTPEELAKERVANIVHILNADEESPFFGRMVVMTTPKKGELSLTNFARKTQHLFTPGKGLLADYELDTQVKIINNYFKALEHVFVEEFSRDIPVVFQTIGFGAFMNVFSRIFTQVYSQTKGGFELKDLIAVFQEFEDFNFDSWRELGSGTQAENTASRDLEAELLAIFKDQGSSDKIRV